jgi:hypothetical protein
LRADKQYDDVRAQKALNRMYLKGLGVPVDESQALMWNSKARKTLQTVAQVCSSSVLHDAVKRYSKGANGWNRQQLSNDIDVGAILVSRVTPEQVVSLNRPFVCLAKGGIENPRFETGTDECDTIVYTDIYGNQTEEDDCSAALASKGINVLVNKKLREMTFTLPLEVQSIGNGVYKVGHGEASRMAYENLNLNLN